MTQDTTSRREFLARTTTGIAGLSLAAASGARPAAAETRPDDEPPGKELRVGVIGVGGRGQGIMHDCLSRGAQVVAVADIYEARLVQAVDGARNRGADPEPYFDYRKLLERDDLDAVGIGTPDHLHAAPFLDSVSAGLDVYLEKPVCHTLREGGLMVEATRRYNRIVQVGNQFRSGNALRRAREVIESGRLGRVVKVHAWDHRNWAARDIFTPPQSALDGQMDGRLDWDAFLGSAKKVPFDPWRYFAWRWYWDYAGGMMTDIGAHFMGIIHYVMDVKTPLSCVSNGGNYHFEHWETPDVIDAIWDYGDFAASFSVQFINGHGGIGSVFLGTDASMEVTGEGCRVKPNGSNEVEEEWPFDGSTGQHTANWLECIKTRQEPNSDIEYGNQVFATCHLANQAYLRGRRLGLQWDGPKASVTTRVG